MTTDKNVPPALRTYRTPSDLGDAEYRKIAKDIWNLHGYNIILTWLIGPVATLEASIQHYFVHCVPGLVLMTGQKDQSKIIRHILDEAQNYLRK